MNNYSSAVSKDPHAGFYQASPLQVESALAYFGHLNLQLCVRNMLFSGFSNKPRPLKKWTEEIPGNGYPVWIHLISLVCVYLFSIKQFFSEYFILGGFFFGGPIAH